jgi:sterol 3beta-glucosyltransferase
LASTEEHEPLTRSFNVEFFPLRGNLKVFLQSPEARGVMAGDPTAVKRANETFFKPLKRRILDDIWEASQGAEVLIVHPGVIVAQRIAEILNIRVFVAAPSPFLSPTYHFPHLLGPQLKLGALFNRLSYLINRVYSMSEYELIADWHRKTLGLRPPSRYKNYLKQNGRKLPVLYYYSSLLFPSPPDWDNSVCVSGFWSLPPNRNWAPPEALLQYLHDGPPPVYIGFGSLAGPDPEKLTELVSQVIKRIPYRVLICGGWGSIKNAEFPRNSFFIERAPHDRLFPYVDAVVHHGGPGSLAAAIKAGKPSVICPLTTDQPFFAAAARTTGVAPDFRMQQKLTANWLVEAVKNVCSTPAMRLAAEELGGKLRAEDGCGNAIHFITRQIEIARRGLNGA